MPTTLLLLWRSLRRIGAVALKETIHVRRDRQTLLLALVMPVMLLLLFGYGVTFDLQRLPIVAVDYDHTEISRQLIQRFGASKELTVVSQAGSAEEGIAAVRRGRAVGVLVVPQAFAKALQRGEKAEVQLIIDGADAATATQAINKADALVSGAYPMRERDLAGVPRIAVEASIFYNPAARSSLLLVPGLVAYILAIVAVLLTALTIAREWERGSIEQLFTTPLRREEIILGKLLPYLGLGVIAVLLVLTAGAWVFDVPIRGSLVALGVSAVLFLAGMLGQGLLISVVTKNQMVATQAGVFSSMLPTMLLSGFIFPISNMPLPLQVIAQVLPATHFIAAMRGILLRGNGFAEVWRDQLALAAFAIAVLTMASRRFRRRLD